MKRKIVVASTNPGKISELSAMLEGDIEWISLAGFEGIGEIAEDGESFAENARKKALGYAKATGLWTIADDSGLVVDALGGKPGVKSARFSGEKASNRRLLDHKNMAKVLELLEGVPREKRTARFVCCLCLGRSDGVLIETEGKLEGVIAEEEKGQNGFGYDPIFYVPESKKTVAELTAEEKNSISHRGNAIRKLKPFLMDLLNMSG
ncbi:MAG: XTP/dITP diphosphatase [Planctomycetota bacterium]|jgi:XTP/dITP diphosphohydrolase